MTKIVVITVLIAAFVPHLYGQKLFVAPIADFALGDDGPTRHEYITNLDRRRECDPITPVAREDLADYTVWFEFELSHYALIWSKDGLLIGNRSNVFSSENVVKDVCNIIREHEDAIRASRD